jgi:hypothetical protein
MLKKNGQLDSFKVYVPKERVAELPLYKETESEWQDSYSLYINNVRDNSYVAIRGTCVRCFEIHLNFLELLESTIFSIKLKLPAPEMPEFLFIAVTSPVNLVKVSKANGLFLTTMLESQ